MGDKKGYCIHDDLCREGKITREFCAHIFITKKDGMFLQSDASILPQGENLPKVRNGTITFIEYQGNVYGITCGHVLDALGSINKANEIEMSKYCELPLPPIAQYHFFVSIDKQQHHVRGNFYKVPAEYGVPAPDIAIARLPSEFLLEIGRKCIKINSWPDEYILQDPYLTGVACGYPEMNRTSNETDVSGINTLGKRFVSLVARFDSFSKERVRIIDQITETNGVNVLSGMSGGPLFWNTEKIWGLAGIIKEGGDLNPNIQTEDNGANAARINIVAEPLPPEKFACWVKQLPVEEFPMSLSSRIFIPEGFRGFKYG